MKIKKKQNKFLWKRPNSPKNSQNIYSRTSVARTPLGPWKLVRDRGSSSQWGLIIAPGQELDRDIFFIFFNMKVCCVFSLESPRRGDSNEYTQYTIFNMNKKNTLNYPKPAAMCFFPRDSRMSSKQPW